MFSSIKYYDDINKTNYYIFIIITHKDNLHYLSLFKYSFYNQLNKTIPIFISIQKYPCLQSNIISCFITKDKIISCFYLNKEGNYTISLLDTELILKNKYILKYKTGIYENNFSFFKSIYLMNEVAIYLIFTCLDYNIPTFLIKNISNNYLISNYLSLYEEVKLLKYDFNNNMLLNDIVKISSKKFCYTTINKNKDIIIVTIFSLYNNYSSIDIKYYSIVISEIIKENKFSILTIDYYNKYFLGLYQNYYITKEKVEVFKPLNILNYPNITEINIDVIEALYKNNYLIIDLYEYIKNLNKDIRYILHNILITINNCKEFKFVSNKTGKEFKRKKYLDIDEKIQIFLKDKDYHKGKTCFIKYTFDIKNIYFDEYNNKNNYINNIDNSYDDIFLSKNFSIENYKGKIVYYNLILNKNLTKECNNEYCEFCLLEEKNYCIICKNKYNFFDSTNNHKFNKTCFKASYNNNKKIKRRMPRGGGGGGRGGKGGGKGESGSQNNFSESAQIENSEEVNTEKETNEINNEESTSDITEQTENNSSENKEEDNTNKETNEEKSEESTNNFLEQTENKKEVNSEKEINEVNSEISTNDITEQTENNPSENKEEDITGKETNEVNSEESTSDITEQTENNPSENKEEDITGKETNEVNSEESTSDITEQTENNPSENKEEDINGKETNEIKQKRTDDYINHDETNNYMKTETLVEIKQSQETNNISEETKEKNNNSDYGKKEEQTQIKQINEKCSKNDILDNKYNKKIDSEQINDIYVFLNNEIIKKANVNKTIEIYTENTVFQISTLEEQKNNENDRTSTIDIGECEDKLRDYYHIPDYYELLIFKVDIK